MKTLSELKKIAKATLEERKEKIASKKYQLDESDLQPGDFILVHLESGDAQYFSKSEDFTPGRHNMRFEVTPSLTLRSVFNFRNIEGDVEIFDAEINTLYQKGSSMMQETGRKIRHFIEEKFGVVDEERTNELPEILRTKMYKNSSVINDMSEELVKNLGYELSLGRYDGDGTDKLITPICNFEFIYLVDAGQDDWGDVCSNEYGILVYQKKF